MKKLILILIMVVSFVATSFAQQTTVEGVKLFDNTSVSIYGGGLGWISPGVSNSEHFLCGIRPNFSITFDKWVNPVVGGELFYETSVNSLPFNKTDHRWTAFDMQNLGVNVLVNMNNLVHHYTGEPDKLEFVPFTGIGWTRGFTNTAGTNFTKIVKGTSNFISADMGVKMNLNLGKEKAWQVNLVPTLTYMIAGENLGVKFDSRRAYATLNLGLTYKFGYRNSWGKITHNFTSAYSVDDYETSLRKNQKTKVMEKYIEKQVVVEKPVKEVVEINLDPHFGQGSKSVDATSAAVLEKLVVEMQDNNDNYVITGYSSVDGNDKFNYELSLDRARAVRDFLVECGIDTKRLTVVGAGETDKFGDSFESNRRVTIEKK